ncbi:MAG: hypothetical protein M0T74_03990 [Desulfitobacterium hafniense]|nr:hypothetical protein [Desulfitobacterium hafniense]
MRKVKKLQGERLERAVNSVKASMSYENMNLNSDEVENVKKVLSGECSTKSIIQEILRKYSNYRRV